MTDDKMSMMVKLIASNIAPTMITNLVERPINVTNFKL